MDVLFDHALPYFGLSPPSSSEDSSAALSSPPNYVGAAIFWSYIGAALYFLTSIVRTLLALRKFAIFRKYPYNGTAVTLFSAGAAASFATLSYHMFRVLIESYVSWAATSTAAAKLVSASATSVPTTLSAILSSPADFVTALMAWSVSSSLFRDFAIAITSSPARWAWAQADLGATLVTAYWMGISGRLGTNEVQSSTRSITPVPKLWTFFALLQILPASLTQLLFMVALLLTPPPESLSKDQKGAAEADDDQAENTTVVLLGRAGYWITSGLLYCFILVEATQPERRHMLIPIILLGRALLFMPAVLPFARLRLSAEDEDQAEGEAKASKSTNTRKQEKESKKTTAVDAATSNQKSTKQIIDGANPFQLVDLPLALLALSAWAVVHQGYWAVQAEPEGAGLKALLRAVDEHPAVSALGYDAVIAAVAFVGWALVGKKASGEAGR